MNRTIDGSINLDACGGVGELPNGRASIIGSLVNEHQKKKIVLCM